MVQAVRRKHHYIYKITRVDGRYYIGMHSTDNLDDGYFGSGKLIIRSIKKHGKEKHIKEIIEHLPSREALKLREKELVNEELLDDKLCMNIRIGGEGGWDHVPRDVVLSNLSKRNKGWSDYNKSDIARKTSSKNARLLNERLRSGILPRAQSPGMLGKSHTAETRQTQSASHSGALNSQFGTCWVTSNGVSRKINKVDLDTYLQKGFSKGRKITTGLS